MALGTRLSGIQINRKSTPRQNIPDFIYIYVEPESIKTTPKTITQGNIHEPIVVHV